MRAVVQRVESATVTVNGACRGRIGPGLLVYLGVGTEDTEKDASYLAEKIAYLRIFTDEEGKMNRSLMDESGDILVVSQFTLYADARKGRRPSYSQAANAGEARQLYDLTLHKLADLGLHVESGRFQAMMGVSSVNDGPVTMLLDSKKQF